MEELGIDYCGSEYGQVACCRLNGNETPDFVIFWKFLTIDHSLDFYYVRSFCVCVCVCVYVQCNVQCSMKTVPDSHWSLLHNSTTKCV